MAYKPITCIAPSRAEWQQKAIDLPIIAKWNPMKIPRRVGKKILALV